MKFTLSWLKNHLDTTASLDEISKTLTAIGLEVEQIIDSSVALKPFTVAKILEAEKHPEADKLRVCKVESNSGILQIVCGAPNARAGLYVVLAQEGAVIPGNGMFIKKTKIRNVESNGMLCSLEELALTGDSAGIIELPENSVVGAPAADALGLADPVIEIAITPNRADCLGVHGVARDLAAAGLGTLKPLPDMSAFKGNGASSISVSIEDTQKCPQFIGCSIKGVKNGASPLWLKQRLEAIGQKSISTLVDITNLFSIGMGRPLHAYDAAKLSGNLVVRAAKEGEKLKALNGKEYTLASGMTVIADSASVLALGGIIGGEASGCASDTTDVFLEVALFEPTSVAKTGRALAIDSDARYRFERGVDVAFVENAAKLAVSVILEHCGGQASELVYAGSAPDYKRTIHLTAERITTLGGVTLPAAKIKTILSALGFDCTPIADGWDVIPPSWRSDVEGEADLVEEVLRINGYDHIPNTPLPKIATISKPALNTAQKRVHLAKRALASRGMMEAVTWSFVPEAQATMFGGTNQKLKLVNPISADLDTMRPSLLPNLLDAAKRNIYRGEKNIKLFEVGLQFHDITPDGQKMVATGLNAFNVDDYTCFAERVEIPAYIENGKTQNIAIKERGGVKASIRQIMALEAKADAIAVLETLGINSKNLTVTANAPSWYHPGCSGSLSLGGKIILAYFGELHPLVSSKFELKDERENGMILSNKRLAGFEIFLDAIPQPRAKTKARPSLKPSDFQKVERDFAFIVDEKISAAEIIKFVAQAEKQLITDISIFDVYTGTGVEAGKKSVAIKVTLQANDRTLSEQDISGVSAAIVSAASKSFGAQLRQ